MPFIHKTFLKYWWYVVARARCMYHAKLHYSQNKNRQKCDWQDSRLCHTSTTMMRSYYCALIFRKKIKMHIIWFNQKVQWKGKWNDAHWQIEFIWLIFVWIDFSFQSIKCYVIWIYPQKSIFNWFPFRIKNECWKWLLKTQELYFCCHLVHKSRNHIKWRVFSLNCLSLFNNATNILSYNLIHNNLSFGFGDLLYSFCRNAKPSAKHAHTALLPSLFHCVAFSNRCQLVVVFVVEIISLRSKFTLSHCCAPII